MQEPPPPLGIAARSTPAEGGGAIRPADILRAMGCAGDAVALIDGETRHVLDANEPMRLLSGWAHLDTLRGEQAFEFLRPEDRTLGEEALEALATREDGVVRLRLETERSRGTPHVYDAIFAATQGAGRRLVLAMLRRAAQARTFGLENPPFRAPWEELRLRDEFEEFRVAFAEGLAQGIRTPLTPIKLYLHLLRQEVGRDRAVFDVLERNLRRVQTVVDDALDAIDLRAGRATLEVDAIRMHELVAGAVEECSGFAASCGIGLRVLCDPVPTFRGDRARLQRAVRWVVESTLAGAPAGSAFADVRLARLPGAIVIESSASRSGSPSLLASREPREEVGDVVATSPPTAGPLGRYLVRVIAELHGGSLDEEAEAGTGGATLRLVLPIGTNGAGPSPEPRATAGRGPGHATPLGGAAAPLRDADAAASHALFTTA